MNISAENNFAFRFACENGHLAVAQWLLSVKPNINNDHAFRGACGNGHLEVAQWLYSKKPDTDICAMDDFAFTYACIYGHMDVAQWLLSLCPDKYQILSYDTTSYIPHKIKRQLNIVGTYPCSKEECAICKETVSNIATECNHQFCQDCITNWLETTKLVSLSCPTCRHPLSLKTSVFRQLV